VVINKVPCRFIAAMTIYAAFAVYLYQTHLAKFDMLQYLLPVNVCLASLGSFFLSRWCVSSYAGSFFASAIYGFGLFILYLLRCQIRQVDFFYFTEGR